MIDGSVSGMERKAWIWKMCLCGFEVSFSDGSYLSLSLFFQPPSLTLPLSLTTLLSMNSLTNSAQTFDETCVKKVRCENRWTAAEDKVLFAQVLKGKSLVCRLVSEFSLTRLKPMVARFVGDLWPSRYREGTTNPVGRGVYPLFLTFLSPQLTARFRWIHSLNPGLRKGTREVGEVCDFFSDPRHLS